MCFNISITDDEEVELTERLLVCACSEEASVVVLNGGCAEVNIEDNDGILLL